jgi:hypothetical protein
MGDNGHQSDKGNAKFDDVVHTVSSETKSRRSRGTKRKPLDVPKSHKEFRGNASCLTPSECIPINTGWFILQIYLHFI